MMRECLYRQVLHRLGGSLPGLEPRARRPVFDGGHKRVGGCAIQGFAEDICVTRMPCRFFYEMEQNPAYRPGVDIAGEPGNTLRHRDGLSQVGYRGT